MKPPRFQLDDLSSAGPFRRNPVKPLRRTLGLFLALGIALLVSPGERLWAAGPKRVLIVHSYGREFSPFNIITATFRTELARQSLQPLEFYEVSLEAARYGERTTEQPLVAYLQAMFAQRPLDLILATAEPASLFLAEHRSELFPATPLVAILNQRLLSTVTNTPNLTVVPIEIDLPLLLENIFQVLPATTNLLMVLGNSPFERYWAEQCRREFAPFTNRLAIQYANDWSLDQILNQVSNLPPRSAVLYGMLAMDAAGVPYEQERALTSISASAKAPVFGVLEHHLGNGIVGGRLVSMEVLGRKAAEAGRILLQGGRPAEVHATGPGKPLYDWRALVRWGVDEQRLPAGSEVRFRQPSQWEEHRWQIVGIGILSVLETALIVALVAQLQRRRHAEETLRESEERLSLATSAARVGVWSWNIARGTIEATPECKQIFGWEPEHVVDFEMFRGRLHPDDRGAVNQALEQAIQKRTIYDTQYRIVRPDGQTRWISARGRCRYNERDAVAMMGVLVDVTDRRTVEEEAAQHRTELAHLARVNTVSELSGSLAHELNQPLGVILSNAQAAQHLLERNPPDLAEVREILTDIVTADRRAGDVIQRLRALLRRGEVALEPLSLNDVVTEVLHLVNSDLVGRGIVVVKELAPNLPLVNGGRVELEQLLMNLVFNAADAMADNVPGTRRLYLKTALLPKAVRVSVRDEGPGLPGDPERLFQPFFTTKPHGLGMGLAICRSIAKAHHGRLWAEPHTERGAVFQLELPSVEGVLI